MYVQENKYTIKQVDLAKLALAKKKYLYIKAT